MSNSIAFRFLRLAAPLALLAWFGPDAAARPLRFESGRETGDVDQVRIGLEVGGDLITDAGGQVARGEMSVVGEFLYHEKTLRLPTTSDPTMRTVRAYEKAGFVHEGALREAYYRHGTYHDHVVMSVLEPEWRARRGA